MRRVLAVATLAAALSAAAGCSGGGGTPTGAPGPTAGSSVAAPPGATAPGGGTAAPAPGGAAGGNAKEVCAAVTQAGSESATKFIGELAKMLEASTGNDKKAADTARRNAEAALAGWATAVKDQAAKATDPRLKAALTENAAEIAKIKPDVTSINESTLAQLQQRVDQLCGS